MPETTTPTIAENDLDFLRRLKRIRNDFRDRELSPIVDTLAPTADEIEAALKAEKGRAARAVERERLQARLAELDAVGHGDGSLSPSARLDELGRVLDPAPEPPSAMLGEIAQAVSEANAPAAAKDDGRKPRERKGANNG